MLKDCIPKKFASMKQMKELFDAEQPELDLIQSEMQGWMKELHIMTCENTISEYEDDYCLDHDVSLTLEQRRARVFAKKGQRFIPRKEYLQNVIQTLLGAQSVLIKEKACEFDIYVATAEQIDNFKIAEDFFREIRPAHWGFTFINNLNREYEILSYFGVAMFEHRKYEMEVE